MMLRMAAIILFSILLYGCGSFATSQVNPKKDDIPYLVENNKTIANAFIDCVFYTSMGQAFGTGNLDKKMINQTCQEQESRYYKSVYYLSFGGPDVMVRSQFRHNTARDTVRLIKQDIIRKMRRAAQ